MIIKWAERQEEMLLKMAVPFDIAADLSDEEIENLYEIVPEYMLDHTDTGDNRPDSDFNICEDIITRLAKIISK